MAGFAARKSSATGSHDSLTVRALVVEDTALLTVDVLGLESEFCQRVRSSLPVPAENVVVHAIHTHGGPSTLPGRLFPVPDSSYLALLESACVQAVQQASASAKLGRLSLVTGSDPDVARNRRRAAGPVDKSLLMLVARDEDGLPLACLVNYACHPVVLGADNLLWTADYPHFVRQALEARYPGATALFLTGCIGDVNTGHSAAASLSAAAQVGRDYPTAENIGTKIAAALFDQQEQPLQDGTAVHSTSVEMNFARRESGSLADLARSWRAEGKTAAVGRDELLYLWADWAEKIAPGALTPLRGRVSLVQWGGLLLVALPGEIFAETALWLREQIAGENVMIAGFCDDNPGYIPPASEFSYGGYEVDEAHRYYGQPATFAPGTAEAIADSAVGLITANNC